MEENRIKLSIVTVTFNSEQYIKEVLSSVLEQEYKNYEYIIVDGGSVDKTIRIVEEMQPQFEGRLKYISEKDNGIYDAMNKGIRMSNGDYIGLINSDDRYTPVCFNKVVETIEKSKMHPDVIYSDLARIDLDGRRCGVFISSVEGLKRGMTVNHPTCFVSRKAYEKYGLFDLQYRIVADYDLMLRIYHSGGKFVKCDDILSEFRDGGKSFNNFDSVIEKYKVQRKYYGLIHCLYIRLRGFYRCKIRRTSK